MIVQNRGITVWLVADGKPGHVNQTMGILRALEHRFTCHTHMIQIRWRIGFFRRLLQDAWSRGWRQPPRWLIDLACHLEKLPVSPPPDVVISAGGNTIWVNAWLAKRYGCSNVFSGKLRQMPPECFTAALTIQPSHHPSVIELDVAPNVVSPERALEAAQTTIEKYPNEKLWCLLVGGDGAGYRYDRSDWISLTDQLNEAAAEHRAQWLIVTSRRTGVEIEELIRSRLHKDTLADTVWYGSGDRRKVVLSFLGAAERVFVTEDSMSMIHESIASGTRVHTLRPKDASPDSNFLGYLTKAEKQGSLKRHQFVNLASSIAARQDDFWRLYESDPSEELCRKLCEKLPFAKASS